MKSGIINVYKERGWTSSDVVVKLRHILNNKKIGHTGTLDPMAEGVLPVCVGRATQLSDYIMDKTKTYTAELWLGMTTDTQDITGSILQKKPCSFVPDEISAVCGLFTGEIYQVPPMYSAVKQNGKKLYELARQGLTVERRPRLVKIYSINIKNMTAPDRFTIEVVCSKGTYIRTLCADIGDRLGVGGCMGALVRTACDNYTIEDSLKLEQITKSFVCGDESFISDMDAAMAKYPAAKLEPSFGFHFLNGLDADNRRYSSESELKQGDIVRVYVNGRFCAVAQVDDGRLHMKCLLADPEELEYKQKGGVKNE